MTINTKHVVKAFVRGYRRGDWLAEANRTRVKGQRVHYLLMAQQYAFNYRNPILRQAYEMGLEYGRRLSYSTGLKEALALLK